MRIKYFAYPTALFLFLNLAYAEVVNQPQIGKRITGQDWILMTQDEKGTYVFTAMEILKKYGL